MTRRSAHTILAHAGPCDHPRHYRDETLRRACFIVSARPKSEEDRVIAVTLACAADWRCHLDAPTRLSTVTNPRGVTSVRLYRARCTRHDDPIPF